MARVTREDGFSLAELIIVIAIVAMVAAAVFGVYDVSQKIYIRSTSLEDAQLGARAGLDRMVTELRLAGAYLGGAIGTGSALPPSIITSASSSGIAFKGDVNADTLNATGDEITVANLYTTNTSTDLVVNQVTGADSAKNVFQADKYIHIQDGPKREVARIAAGTVYCSGNKPCTDTSLTTLKLTASGTQVLTYDYPVGAKVRTLEELEYTYDPATGKITRSVDGGAAEDIVENVTGFTLTYYNSAGTQIAYTTIDEAGEQANRDTIREIEVSITTKGSDGSRRTMTSRVRPRNLGLPQE